MHNIMPTRASRV